MRSICVCLFFRNLCAVLSARDIYRTLSEILFLKANEDRSFVAKMVNLLNTILMTTHELYHLRDELKHFKLPVSSSNASNSWPMN